MPAYLFVTCVISDREAFLRDYVPAAGALVRAHGGRYVLRARGGALLEGGFGQDGAMVVSEFPDRAAAERFWHSDEYADVKKLRAGRAVAQVILAEGEML